MVVINRLCVSDGDTFRVEKSKISIKVKLPNGQNDIEVVVDPKSDTVDWIRQLICDSTGIPPEYQQRLTFEDKLMDGGYHNGNDDEDGGGDSDRRRNKTKLSNFDLKEFSTISLLPSMVVIKRVPENEQFVIEGIDFMKDILQELKKRIATTTSLPTFKQRLVCSMIDEEYDGNKDTTKTLHQYDIKDGDVIHLEKSKITLRIALPHLDELDLTVDPRKDDLQKVRDYVFKNTTKVEKSQRNG